MKDRAKHIPIDQSVTSHNNSGITAHTVNIGQHEVRQEVLCVNARDGEQYACQSRLTLVNAPAGARFLVEATETDDIPIDLELTPLNAAIVMVNRKDSDSPAHKLIEMAPPLASTYIATMRADEPIVKVFLRWEIVP